jgi:hypothetical protein
MINFRFHIISLVAVFLALALGIFLGSAVGEPTIVGNLNNRINDVEKLANARRDENDELRTQNERLRRYIDQSSTFAVANRLAGKDVVVVAERGVDNGPVKAELAMLREAGANAPAIVWVEPKFELKNSDDISRMASMLHLPVTDPASLRAQGLAALARRLTRPPTASELPDVLSRMVDEKFVSVDGLGRDQLGDLPTRRAWAVLVDGPDGEIADADVFGEEVTAFADLAVPTVAAEVGNDSTDANAPARGSAVAVVRSDPDLEGRASTVDNLDAPEGRVASVLALQQSFVNDLVGDYGYGRGAQRVVPEPPAQ